MEQLVKLLCDQKQARPGRANPPCLGARKSAVTAPENGPTHSKPPADDRDLRWHIHPHAWIASEDGASHYAGLTTAECGSACPARLLSSADPPWITSLPGSSTKTCPNAAG